MQPGPRARQITAWPVLLGLFGLLAGGCLGNYGYAVSAPPIATTVRLVEESPEVARTLGAPVKVSLVTTRTLRRSPLAALTGKDYVTLYTRAKGTRGEAMLRVSAMNLDGQGWSGDFSLEAEGRQLLREGAYVTEGGGRIVAGRFGRDGEAISNEEDETSHEP